MDNAEIIDMAHLFTLDLAQMNLRKAVRESVHLVSARFALRLVGNYGLR